MKKFLLHTYEMLAHLFFFKKKAYFLFSYIYEYAIDPMCCMPFAVFFFLSQWGKINKSVPHEREKEKKKYFSFFWRLDPTNLPLFRWLCYLQIIVHRLIVIHNIKIIQSYFVITSKALKPFVTMHDPASIIFMIILSIFHHYFFWMLDVVA
jgi:hypothetical protein